MTIHASTSAIDLCIGHHLDNLLKLRWIPASSATRIHCPTGLPPRLERCIDALPAATVWRAYSDGAEVYCSIARAGRPISADEWAIALDVYFLDGDATIWAAGVWEYEWDRSWRLIQVLDTDGTEFQLDSRPIRSGPAAPSRLIGRSRAPAAPPPDLLSRTMRPRKPRL